MLKLLSLINALSADNIYKLFILKLSLIYLYIPEQIALEKKVKPNANKLEMGNKIQIICSIFLAECGIIFNKFNQLEINDR